MDTLRADRIKSKQRDVNLTPFIHKLLKNSYYFENCIVNSTWTLPSHISMFTGLYESQNYYLSKNIYKLSERLPILPEILNQFGYSTLCYTENPWISKNTGLARGFDVFYEKWVERFDDNILNKIDIAIKTKISSHIPLNFWQKFKNLIERIIQKFLWINKFFGKNRNSLDQIDIYFQNALSNNKKSPYFFFFNVMVNHAPYFSTKQEFRLLNITNNDFKKIRDIYLNPLKYYIKVNLGSKVISKKKISILKKFYDASVHVSDRVVKKILEKLDAQGLLDNTFVIITSDHGELLGDKADHYYWTHGVYQSVNEALIKVPLIIYNRNFTQNSVSDLVELKDIFHTILHLTDINRKNKINSFDIKKSIMYQINKHTTPKYILGEFMKDKADMVNRINFHRDLVDKSLIPKLFNNIYYIRSDKYKLIRYENTLDEFYNILIDPNEINNIIDRNDSNYKDMEQKLIELTDNRKMREEVTNLLTYKEKLSIKKIIHNFKIKGI